MNRFHRWLDNLSPIEEAGFVFLLFGSIALAAWVGMLWVTAP